LVRKTVKIQKAVEKQGLEPAALSGTGGIFFFANFVPTQKSLKNQYLRFYKIPATSTKKKVNSGSSGVEMV